MAGMKLLLLYSGSEDENMFLYRFFFFCPLYYIYQSTMSSLPLFLSIKFKIWTNKPIPIRHGINKKQETENTPPLACADKFIQGQLPTSYCALCHLTGLWFALINPSSKWFKPSLDNTALNTVASELLRPLSHAACARACTTFTVPGSLKAVRCAMLQKASIYVWK